MIRNNPDTNANRKVTNRYFVLKLHETLRDIRQNLVCIHELLPILHNLSTLFKSTNSKIIKIISLEYYTGVEGRGEVNVKKFPTTPLAAATFLIY